MWLFADPPYVGGGESANVAYAYVRRNEDYENVEGRRQVGSGNRFSGGHRSRKPNMHIAVDTNLEVAGRRQLARSGVVRRGVVWRGIL